MVGAVYLDERQAYERFRALFAGQPELVDAVVPGSVPTSFEFTVCDPAAYPDLERRLAGMPGVDQVLRRPRPEERGLPADRAPDTPSECGGGARDR